MNEQAKFDHAVKELLKAKRATMEEDDRAFTDALF